MRAGTLRDQINVQAFTPGPGNEQWGPDGGQWSDLATVWASVTPVTAREQLQAGGIKSETSYAIRVRYRPDVSGQNRLVYRGNVLDIVGVIDVGGRRRELEITATQHPPEVADG